MHTGHRRYNGLRTQSVTQIPLQARRGRESQNPVTCLNRGSHPSTRRGTRLHRPTLTVHRGLATTPAYDTELEKLTIADLAYLANSWRQPTIDDMAVRRESAALRRLLVDERPMLMRHLRQLGQCEPQIQSIDLRAAVGGRFGHLKLACAAHVWIAGALLGTFPDVRGATTRTA